MSAWVATQNTKFRYVCLEAMKKRKNEKKEKNLASVYKNTSMHIKLKRKEVGSLKIYSI
jgi:hypothetical protein